MKERKHGLLTNAMRKAMKKSRNDEEMLASLATASKELDDDDLFFVTGGAQYEADSSELKSLVNNSGLSPSTQTAIQALIDSGVGSSFVDSGSNAQTDSIHNSSDSSPVAIFTDGGTAVFNGNVLEKPTNDPYNSLQDGNGLEKPTNDPNNSLQLDVGQASLNSGNGQDDIVLSGTPKGDGQDDIGLFGTFNKVETGKGDLGLLTLDKAAQQQVEISVDAGDGFDIMQLFGASIKHSFSFTNGKFKMN